MLFIVSFAVLYFFCSSGSFLRSEHAARLNDAWVLHDMAANHAHKGKFLMSGKPTLTQLPAYPFLISCIYKATGPSPAGEYDSRWVLYFQMLMASGLFSLFIAASRPLLGNFRFLLAGLLLFDLHWVMYPCWMLTEFWVVLCWILAWIHLERIEITDNKKHLFAAYFWFALAANIKPLAGYFALCVTAGFLILPWARKRYGIKRLLAALMLFILLLQPLLLRNMRMTGEYPRYSTISSFNMHYFNIPIYLMQKKGITLSEARFQRVNRMRERVEELKGVDIEEIPESVAADRHSHRKALGIDEFEYAKLADQLNREFLSKEWPGYIREHFLNGFGIFTASNLSNFKLFYNYYPSHSFSTMTPTELMEVLSSGGFPAVLLLVRIYELVFVFSVLMLFLVSLVLSFDLWKKRPSLHYVIFIIIYMICVTGVNTWGRFRYLLMPFLTFGAVLGAKAVLRFWRSRQSAPLPE